MRTFETVIGEIRRRVFYEVAKLACEGGDYSKLEELPYLILPGEDALYRDSIFLERAIVGERLRLAIGLPLRSMEEHAPLSLGIEASAIDEQYYEPPLVNIIKFACNACPENYYVVSDRCMNCIARPCTVVCPTKAVSIVNHKALINQEKCIKCGRCQTACPYHSIIHMERPCAEACGVDAIGSNEKGRAVIDYNKCVSCGMCIVNCPFGAISDKGQFFQMVHALKKQENLIVIIAPSFLGQFGPKVTPGKINAAMLKVGFSKMVEVAIGADLCALEEAKEYLKAVPKEQPFITTSCCYSWITMTRKEFPQLAHNISMTLTPMVLTARLVKNANPGCRVVFVGPCAAKKLEAMREDIRSDVDFVLTFEEMMAIFDANNLNLEAMPEIEPEHEATAGGRGFAVNGGVADAVTNVVKQLKPEHEVKIAAANGLRECVELLKMAKDGKYNGYLLEGMACPGGCVAGTGTLRAAKKSAVLVNKYKNEAADKTALDSKYKDWIKRLNK